MIITIKTLIEKKYSQRAIAKTLGINRKTVKKYVEQIEKAKSLQDIKTPVIAKSKKLDYYKAEIEQWLSQSLTGVLIHQRLIEEKNVSISYASISRFLKNYKTPEVYIPLISKPAEEAQVDFGYLGRFLKDGKVVKVWVFSMVLSYSRYSYQCIVTNQSVKSFIECHIRAFEYFTGVPNTVKIDNLKAGVIAPDFYEPQIQRQYAEFLEHYNSLPITARIRRGQDKGKVESSVKYVKNNFLKRIRHNDFYRLEKDLFEWTNNICNKRLHGTTKKIPYEVFIETEKDKLKALPTCRYQILEIEHRKANSYAHISFRNNFYSVPYKYIGKILTIKSTSSLLKIYDDITEIAIHPITRAEGEFITKNEHLPPEKQALSEDELTQNALAFGEQTYKFLLELKKEKPYYWQRIIKGIFKLEKKYDVTTVNLACKKALDNNILNLHTIRKICQTNSYQLSENSFTVNKSGGFAHELKSYDKLINQKIGVN